MRFDAARTGCLEDFGRGGNAVERTFAPRPAVNEKEVGNRGDAVGFVSDNINMAVSVAVLAVGLERRGHELPESHGARKGARHGNRLNLLPPAEFEEVREFCEVVL